MTPDPVKPSRVQVCVDWLSDRIARGVHRGGERLPSIRTIARERGLSPFTVTEAYARLVASGLVSAKAGSGFYVAKATPTADVETTAPREVDLPWLLHHMLESGTARGPGIGTLPADWLHDAGLDTALRAVARQGRWQDSGRAAGFAPLRQLLQQRLAMREIVVPAGQIVLTTGITQALDLTLRCVTSLGDAVLVLEPCWFGIHGVLAAHGLQCVGIPCDSDGPDLDVLERRMTDTGARLLVLSSVARNPCGDSLSVTAIEGIARLARARGVVVFEDDAYGDLCDTPTRRVAAHPGAGTVIHAGSWSKTLAANLRVGFVACDTAMARRIADAKVTAGFTTPELNERLMHRVLVDGRFDRHCAALRARLRDHREAMRRLLAGGGVPVDLDGPVGDGPFLWVDLGVDTRTLAADALDHGLLVAPGALFGQVHAMRTWTRVNVTTPREDIDVLLACRARMARD